MSLLDNLISYWKLDEASGNAIDAHGVDDMIAVGNPGTASGIVGNSRTFNGSTQRFGIANNARVQTGNVDFTFAFWYYPTANPSFNVSPLAKWQATGNQREYSFFHLVTSNVMIFQVSTNGLGGGSATGVISSFGAIPTNQWAFIVGWHDAGNDTINIRVNTTEDSVSHSGGVFVSSANFNLGTFGDVTANNSVTGRIDEVGFWKRSLTTQERTKLWNSGNGLSYDLFAGRRRNNALIGLL